MEMKTVKHGKEEVKEEKSGVAFSRFKAMVENSARVAVAAALVSCGGTPTTSDGGHTGNDGGADVADSGPMQNDSGTGGMDSGTDPPGPCVMYPQGDPHRHTFTLQHPDGIQGSQYSLNFLELDINGSSKSAIFMLFISFPTTNYITVVKGTPQHASIPDVGDTVFDLCDATDNACTNTTGDQSCTATLASTRLWQF